MKKVSIFLVLAVVTANVFAQADRTTNETVKVKNRGVKKEALFAGGSFNLGFGSGETQIGVGPYFGVSLNRYVDVALGLNYNYTSQRDYYVGGDAVHQSVIGPQLFTRIYPVPFLFAQAGFEQNFITQTYSTGPYGSPIPSFHENAPSFLIGPGLASGRRRGSNTYFYLSVLFDVARDKYSPYVDEYGRVNPIVRAGINVSLFPENTGRERRERVYRPRRRMMF